MNSVSKNIEILMYLLNELFDEAENVKMKKLNKIYKTLSKYKIFADYIATS